MTTKIAIVGGGMGGLSAAFDLVAKAKSPNDYKITVYERDWRLGGKGASGRSHHEGYGQRIEEHGLHVLMGFYDNVFEILHRCWEDLRMDGTLPMMGSEGKPWWVGVLHGIDTVRFSEPPIPGTTDWRHWCVGFESNTEVIGLPARELPTVRRLMLDAVEWFVDEAKRGGLLAIEHHGLVDSLIGHAKALVTDMFAPDEHLRRGLLSSTIERVLQKAYAGETPGDLRRHQWFVSLYFSGLCLIGAVKDILPDEDGFRDRLDAMDWKTWIAKYNFLGLPPQYHCESAPLNAVYDLVFSRGCGFAAGSAFYDTLLMILRYRGHVFYKMAGGMGDVVFAPLYLWLKNLGVEFKFFHDLRDIQVSGDRIQKLVFDVKSPASGLADTFNPLIKVECLDDDGDEITLPCWPVAPDATDPVTEKTVEVTAFDHVILAIPVGAIRERNALGVSRCQALFSDPDFAAMANGMVTQPTRAVQLWFKSDLKSLGWADAPLDPALGPVLGSYVPALKYNSWADMSQVLPRETWGDAEGPKNIAYLCDTYDDNLDPQAATDIVRRDGIRWLKEAALGLWTKTGTPFSWDLLHDPGNRTGEARFESQYWRANVEGSSQYVTGAPNTSKLRLDPHGTKFSNLFLAGDWVATPLNAGCVEGAAMGGRLAAKRILELTPANLRREDTRIRAAIARATTPPFLTRDGDLPLVQPVRMGDLTMHGYVFHADRDILNETLRQTFEPLGITATAPLPIVLVASAKVNQIRSDVWPEVGYMPEAELGFWLVVHLKWEGGSSYGFYLPYLFVDNVAALLAGRDIYGFNKILGQFEYEKPGDVDPTTVKAQVLHVLGKDSPVEYLPIASLTIPEPHDKTIEPAWDNLGTMVASLVAKAAAGGYPMADPALRAGLALPSFPVFFLKQLRAASNGALTDFQAAVSARVKADNVSGGWISDVSRVTLSLPSHATMNIAKTLGLTDKTPFFGFWAHLDAVVGLGEEIDPDSGE